MVKVAIFNDTGNYPHIGCKAVSNAHNKLFIEFNVSVLFRHFVGEFASLQSDSYKNSLKLFFDSVLVKEILEVDAVIVNGEGTIHHGAGTQLLTILAGAQALGKRTYLINSVLQNIPKGYFEVLRHVDDLVVRDIYSFEYMREEKISCRLAPDSILMADFARGDDLTFAGKIVVTDCMVNMPSIKEQLELLLQYYGEEAVYFPLEGANADNWQFALAMLSRSKLVVTGRHHGLYLALMAKRPFVALSSNTWKVEGTLAAIDGMKWLWKSGIDLVTLCELAYASVDEFLPLYECEFLKNSHLAFDVFINDFHLSTDTVFMHKYEMDMKIVKLASKILLACDTHNILVVGHDKCELIEALYRHGVDRPRYYRPLLSVSQFGESATGCFYNGSVPSLPFEAASFRTAVFAGNLDYFSIEDLALFLDEIFRVTSRFAILVIRTNLNSNARSRLDIFSRSWWEAKCFSAGFRKHPSYYKVNAYEALNEDAFELVILLEKIPAAALAKYPLSSLDEERGLHMDMTRDTGERSDAHIIRYQWACNYIKTGDRVLDAACGLGYGGHVIRHLTHAATVVGVDGSAYAIDYAQMSFPCEQGRAHYRCGLLPDILAVYPDGSFDVIVSFETLEHVEQPQQLLNEFHRLLSPGGRVIVSVPNDWSDQTGDDPNPFHLHVYDWARLTAELSSGFILEDAFAQTASQCKVAANGGNWEQRPRSLKQVAISQNVPEDCEWWLMTAMKSPLGATQPYQERLLANLAAANHPSTRFAESYLNPWLHHAMVNLNCRLKNGEALEKLALEVTVESPHRSNDHGAALCVVAYRAIAQLHSYPKLAEQTLAKIDAYVELQIPDPMALRWRVSLLSIKAKLLEAQGKLDEAQMAFVVCARHDVRSFGIHLATKTTEAWFEAGRLAYALGDHAQAKTCWASGVESGATLLSVSLDDILINPTLPNLFNYGDGVREYTVAWDNIARCANGLHLLAQGGQIDRAVLESCFQTEYNIVTRDLQNVRSDLRAMTRDLAEIKQLLVERTARLEQCSSELIERTRDLVEVRSLLVERTERLEQALKMA